MIVRKPYAFLIKYFKVIHITIFILMTYLLFKTRNIYIFFKEFLSSGTYTYVEDIVNKYINIPMIIISIVLVAVLFLVYFLMRQKKKPVFYYLMAIIFYTITFSSLIFFMSVYKDLEYRTFTNQALVIYRDLSMVLYYLNYIFLTIAFIRGFGFNVKKFNFDKDIKELDITEEDREEIEVSSNIDYEVVSNYFRKRKRYLKYYFKENSFILIVFLVIILLSSIAYISVNKFILNKDYLEGDSIIIDNFEYTINNSYITNKDKYGNYIKDSETNYLIVDFSIINKNLDRKKIEIDLSRVKINNNYYYLKNNLKSKVDDLGVVYENQTLINNTNNNYILVFEIANVKDEKVILELYSSKQVVDGEAIIKYKNIVLNPISFTEIDLGNFKLMDEIDFNNTYLEDLSFNLNNYELLDQFSYTYTKCDQDIMDGKCLDYQATIVPSFKNKILKINYGINNKKINLFDYINISYLKDEKNYIMTSNSIKNITPTNLDDNIVLLEVPNDINEDIEFKFNVRGIKFNIIK